MPRRLVLLTLLLFAACGFNDYEEGVRKSNLVLMDEGTVPRDSTEFVYDADGLNLVASFNRAIEDGDIAHVEIVPRPVMGEVFNPGSNLRQILIESAVFDPRYTAYRLVLDGPWLAEPQVISYYSAEAFDSEPGFAGNLFIGRPGSEPNGILVYALVPPGDDEEFNLTGQEETLFGRPVVGVTRTIVVPTEEGGWYRMAGLHLGKPYLAFAILDTNRDGVYDILEDWWGFYRNEIGQPVEIQAGVPFGGWRDPPKPDMNPNVNFWLVEPGTFDPGLE